MPAVIPIILTPTPRVAACLRQTPTPEKIFEPAIIEVETKSGSPMPQAEISRVMLHTATAPCEPQEIKTDHPILGSVITHLSQAAAAEDLFNAMVLWGHWSLNDTPTDRLAKCEKWHRQYARTLVTYLGFNEEKQDFFQIKDIRGKIDPALEDAIASLDDEDEVQVFLLRAVADLSHHQLLKMVPDIRQDLGLWATQLDSNRHLDDPILQTSRTSYVRLAPLHPSSSAYLS